MIKTLYKPFQHWSEKGSVYLVSDTHFEDDDREFMGYKISEQEQIYLLNEYCHKNDTFIHLGDVGNPEYMNKLKCHKILLTGNHDTAPTQMEKYFEEVYTGPLWIAEKIVLSHEPLQITFGFQTPVCLNIHGHDHSGEFYRDSYHLNLAQNVFGYFPLNLKGLIESGILKNITTAHRATIEKRVEKNGIRL
jgi:calcineurin-like phosphoesterase family protein